MNSVAGTSAYATAALRNAAQRIATCQPGDRGRVVYRESAGVGSLLHLRAYTHEDAEAVLVDAAIQSGMGERAAQGHVRRGLLRGASNPRDVGRHSSTPWRSPAPISVHPVMTSGKTLPPSDEVGALWNRSTPVCDDEEVASALRHRKLDPDTIALWDAARVLPTVGPLPRWARCGRTPWTRSGHRLLIPMFDDEGRLASFRARYVGTGAADRKSLAPSGYRAGGLVFADSMARQVLAGSTPTWWTPSFVFVEGEMDWLTWVQQQPECNEHGPAVIGVIGGSWNQAFADRIPDKSRVVVRTHHDAAGDSYARTIAQTLAGRCQILRSNPGGVL